MAGLKDPMAEVMEGAAKLRRQLKQGLDALPAPSPVRGVLGEVDDQLAKMEREVQGLLSTYMSNLPAKELFAKKDELQQLVRRIGQSR
jgi:hypothetical protein